MQTWLLWCLPTWKVLTADSADTTTAIAMTRHLAKLQPASCLACLKPTLVSQARTETHCTGSARML